MSAGDHLLVKRRRWFAHYYHHGIDVGNDTVVHFTGSRKKDATVVESSLNEFLKGGVKEIWPYSSAFVDLLLAYRRGMQDQYGRPDPMLPFLDDERIKYIRARIEDPEKAVAEARKHVGKKGCDLYSDQGYNLYSNNCEHFAIYCKTGLALSIQVIEHVKFYKDLRGPETVVIDIAPPGLTSNWRSWRGP